MNPFDCNFLYLTNNDGFVFRVEEFEISRSIDRMDEYVFTCTAMPTRNFDAIKTASFDIKKVIFNDPATIVMWADGTKTVVKCQDGDIYDKRTGLLLCMAKKMYGNKNKFNDILNRWCPEEYNPGIINIDFTVFDEACGEFIFGGKADA